MSLYKREDSPHWWANIRVPGHPRLRVSTDTADRKEAGRVHDELRAELWKKPRRPTGSPRLRPFEGRPGAMDAYRLPLRGF